jgi:hypothetical protein
VSGRFEQRRSAIVDMLSRCATAVTEASPLAWRLTGSDGAEAITARWEEPWLLFETVANGAAPAPESDRRATTDASWELLRRQEALPATCRYGQGSGASLRVFGEVAFEDTADAGARCEEIVRGLEAARRRKPEFRSTAAPAPEATDLTRLCEEIGWSVNQRPDGRLVGSLPGVKPSPSAELSAADFGSRLSTEITTLSELGEASRQALGEVLLRLGRFARFTRPTIHTHDDGSAVRLETRLPRPATAAELRHALTAITAAFGACAQEVNVLRDETIATEYLTVRGEAP